MKKFTVVLSLLFLAAIAALPAGVQAASSSKICENLRGDLKKTAGDLAETQAELNSVKVRVVSERQYARELTNKYHRAKEAAEQARAEGRHPASPDSFFLTPDEARKIKRTEKAYRAARKASLQQGRVVKRFERESRKLGAQVRALTRAYKTTKRNLKRNNC